MTPDVAVALYDCLLGAEWRGRQFACPLHDDSGTSFAIDERRGTWACRAGCGDGDADVLARRMLGDDDARDLLRELATTDGDEQKQTNTATAARNARTLRGTVADDGTIAAYLRHRGLAGDVPAALHLHRALPYFDDAGKRLANFPAIIAEVQTLAGETVALHRTYLAPGGAGKAEVPTPRKLTSAIRSGATRGAAIRLAEPVDGRLALTEGIETALAVTQATGAATWACVSAGGLAAVEVPESVREVAIYADHDAAGVKAANEAAARFHTEGRTIPIIIPEREGDDWLDVLVRDGAEALRQARAKAEPWRPAAKRTASAGAQPIILAGALTLDGEQLILACRDRGQLLVIKCGEVLRGGALKQRYRFAAKPDAECRVSPTARAAIAAGTFAPDSQQLFDDLLALFARHVEWPTVATPALVATWTMATYLFPVFMYFPYLLLNSLTKRSGKSLVEEMLAELAFNATPPQACPTPAILYRDIHANSATVVLDEIETLGDGDKERRADLLAVLNVGFKRGATVPRSEKRGGGYRTVRYSAYSPKVLAGIKEPADTIRDRALTIRMRRKAPGKAVARFNVRKLVTTLQDLRDRLHGFAFARAADVLALYDADDELALPAGLDDRARDILEPLFAVAGVIDADAGDRAVTDALTRAARELMTARADDTASEATITTAIEALAARFPSNGATAKLVLTTADAVTMFSAAGLDWVTTPARARGLLRRLGFASGVHRPPGGGDPMRGYGIDREAVADLEARYVPTAPSLPEDHDETPRETARV